MKNDRFVIIILLSLIIISCEKKEETSKIEIMPIAEGNFWTYKNTNHSYNEIDTSTLEIGVAMEIEGHKGNLIGTSYLIRSDEYGNTIQVGAFSEYDTVISESIIYKCKINKGESFDYNMILSSLESNEFVERSVLKTCINTDTLISTPAGNFACIVYEYSPDNGSNVFRDYMCINVGKVKSERFEDGRLFSSSVLINYELK